MPSISPTIKFSIYKIRDLTGCEKKLASKRYSKINLRKDFSDFELWVGVPVPRRPKWLEVLNFISADPKQLNPLAKMSNSGASFVLLVKSGGEDFAVCGGPGSFVIQEFIVDDFGLDILSRVVDPDRIKYMKSRYLAGRTAQEESVYKEYYNYEFDPTNWGKITKEILGEISKIDLTEYFDLTFTDKYRIRLDGKNSLSLNRSISIEDLRTLISRIVKIEAQKYKFKIISGYQEVESRELKGLLAKELVMAMDQEYQTYLANPDEYDETRVGISYADVKEFLFCDRFEIHFGGQNKEVGRTLELSDIFSFLNKQQKSDFKDSYLDSIVIQGFKDDDDQSLDNKLKSFIYAELSYKKKFYLFVDRKWFSINENFQKTVNQKVREIIQGYTLPGFSLPAWKISAGKLETEDDYIDTICSDSKLLKLHRDHIFIHGSDKCEVCDVVDIRNPEAGFIYIKKGFGSKFREMLAQVRSSGELFARFTTFQSDAQAKIREKTKTAMQLAPKEVRLIMAFTDGSINRQKIPLEDRLTTVVKTDLIHTMEMLDTLRYKGYLLYEIQQQ